jgi:polysaccharide export outer membrane protein
MLMVKNTVCLLVLLSLALLLNSCFGSKPVSYFQDGTIDSSVVQQVRIPEPVIQKGDILGITVFSDNPEATAIYNQAGGATLAPNNAAGVSRAVNVTASAQVAGASGYLVDDQGNIFMHAIGSIHAEGLTKQQLNAEILGRLTKMGALTNPYCVIRFNNFKVTVLGEVKSPGVYTLPGEKASVLEAIGLAGDISDYGLKDRVLLVRENQGKRSYHQINLRDPQIFTSDYFYLKQNDLLVVDMDKKKPTAQDIQSLQYITIAVSIVSVAAVVISLFR